MLQTIRDKITGWIAWIMLGAIGVVFVFWGIHFQGGPATYAAKVDGEKIPIQTVQRAWQQQQSQLQQMLRDELPEEMKKAQQAAILDQFVRQTLLTQRAGDYGYRVSDAELAQRIFEIPAFHVDGKFDKDRYSAVLRSNGLTEAQVEADIRDELLIRQLQTGVIDSAFVVPYELQRRYELEKQQREVDYALIPASDFAATVAVTDEQIQKWYDENKTSFLLPETVNLQYIELTRAEVEQGVTASEQDLKDYYERIKDRLESPERRHGRHILITTGEGVDDAAAQKKAEELVTQAKGGADFAQLAKDNSKDPGSASQGGDLGWTPRGALTGPFAPIEEALYSMTPGEVRGPVKTQFGYHVLKLDEVEAGHRQSFDEARVEVEAEYRKERSQQQFYDRTQKLADTAFASLTELDSVAKTLNLPLKTVSGFTREGGGELGQDPNVIEAAFSDDVLERRQNSPLVTVGEDRALVLRVADHKPAEPRPLAEVRPQIEAQLKAQAIREAAAKKGADAVAQLKNGEAWSAVTTSAQLSPVGKRFVTREDAVAPPAVLRGVFSAPAAAISESKPYYAGVTTDDGNYAVYAVTQVRSGDAKAEPEQEMTTRRRRTERQLGNEEFAGYVAEAERRADIIKNPQVFQ
jgi:peptidyl-prolyl cis-trans isomerase D